MILVVFGIGANAQVTLSRGEAGDYMTNALGWGLGVTFGLYVAMGTRFKMKLGGEEEEEEKKRERENR